MGQFLITPESRTEPFVELSRTRKGRLFRKHILTKGPLYANGRKIDVDDEFMESVVKNFHAKHCDIVQVPIVGKDNQHSEDPRDNIGEVVDLKVEGDKLYSYIDSRKDDASEELGNTLIGASAMFSTNYTDTTTDTQVGPTLLHVAITNRPHVLNLDDFEEVIAMSADGSDEVLLLSEQSEEPDVEPNEDEETQTMPLEELLATLKSEHDIDVTALQESVTTLQTERDEALENVTTLSAERDTLKSEAENAEEIAVKLSNSIKEHLKSEGIIKLSADDSVSEQAEALIGAVADAGSAIAAQKTEIVNLSGRITSLEEDKKHTQAASVVSELVAAGRILPRDEEAMVELRLSNPEIFDKIVPETPLVSLSQESGTSGDGAPSNSDEFVSSEVDRLLGR